MREHKKENQDLREQIAKQTHQKENSKLTTKGTSLSQSELSRGMTDDQNHLNIFDFFFETGNQAYTFGFFLLKMKYVTYPIVSCQLQVKRQLPSFLEDNRENVLTFVGTLIEWLPKKQ